MQGDFANDILTRLDFNLEKCPSVFQSKSSDTKNENNTSIKIQKSAWKGQKSHLDGVMRNQSLTTFLEAHVNTFPLQLC